MCTCQCAWAVPLLLITAVLGRELFPHYWLTHTRVLLPRQGMLAATALHQDQKQAQQQLCRSSARSHKVQALLACRY